MLQRIVALIVSVAAALIVGGIDYVSDIFSGAKPEEVVISESQIGETVEEKPLAELPSLVETNEEPEPEPESEPEVVVPSLPEVTVVIPEAIVREKPELSEKEIPAESIVGLNCYYRHKGTGDVFNTGRGSGVVIHPNGYILTARHVVDYGFALTLSGGLVSDFELADASEFDRCDVGVPPNSTSLPDPDTIRSVNPSTQLPVLGYTATLAHTLPSYEGKSSSVQLTMDYAVLKIDGTTEDAQFFGITSIPNEFRYATILTEEPFPPVGEEILTYGFPGDTTSGKLATFNTLYLVGSVGTVTEVYSDGFIESEMEISGGRSGSPLFWKGRVAGIVTAYKQGNRGISFSLGVGEMMDTLQQFLP